MNNEKRLEIEIEIYRLVKNDIQQILEAMEYAEARKIKTILHKYIIMVDRKIISLEKGEI